MLDGTNTPIPGVTVRIKGTSLEVVTNDQGQFTILGVPVGALIVDIDGSTAIPFGSFPHLGFPINTISGHGNTLRGPVHLHRIDLENAKLVGGNEDVILEMAGVLGFRLKVFAHSATFADGSKEGLVASTQAPRDKMPMAPEGGDAPLLAGSFSPPGVIFDPPAQITYPNASGLPPGTIVDIFSYDHDLERYVSVGTGTVSTDGSVITSDPGFGIVKTGWHYTPPPPDPGTCVDACKVCKRCDLNQGICVPDFDPATQCCDKQFGTRPKFPIEDLAACPNRKQKFPPAEPNGCTGLPGDGQILPIIPVSAVCIASSFGLFTPDCNIHDQCYDDCSRSKGSCDVELFSNWETSCATIDDFNCRTNCNLNVDVFAAIINITPPSLFYEPAQRAVCQCCP